QQQQQHADDNKEGPGKGNGATQWPEPMSLVAPREAETPYPINALPKVLRDAVVEYREYGQQPLPLIATSALSCVSLATQGLAERGWGRVSHRPDFTLFSRYRRIGRAQDLER